MYTKQRINLNCYSTCQLSCVDCLKSQGYCDSFYMDMDSFRAIVDKCFDYGFRVFELTPPYGDPLLDPLIIDRVRYLSSLDIEEVFFYTNLVGLTRNMLEEMAVIPKFKFRVSVYGDSEEMYNSHTMSDSYSTFIDNFNMLVSFTEENGFDKLDEISMRFGGYNRKKLSKVTNNLYRNVNKLVLCGIIDMPDDSGIDEFSINTGDIFNCQDDISTPPVQVEGKSGICPMAIWDNGIYPDGDVVLCKWCDANKKTVIGNVFRQSLDEIYGGLYMTIMEEQRTGLYRGICAACNIHKSDEYAKEFIR